MSSSALCRNWSLRFRRSMFHRFQRRLSETSVVSEDISAQVAAGSTLDAATRALAEDPAIVATPPQQEKWWRASVRRTSSGRYTARGRLKRVQQQTPFCSVDTETSGGISDYNNAEDGSGGGYEEEEMDDLNNPQHKTFLFF